MYISSSYYVYSYIVQIHRIAKYVMIGNDVIHTSLAMITVYTAGVNNYHYDNQLM